ncbi:bacteriochlorophyll synthase 43 kDa subunit [Methanothermobacter thermautotrophicus str. Delta H]|uniref:Digeranylgeranylglycerophospholipid reductase 1 n=1 Tax=Methanothermobacter thermautotrophicus (strain ATCC 29096 / DSM 1053 / JCM 10044 / NBRC 100330 / Delta H) TaxID=187420 RepID=GGR1_METTH|nr:RecName: Full=Digeranylgeranylglycerophospholipid reductase 1; Short=DGGGPL reductase 1; AltName: Full=2,3-bis-O-geranylgeranylglyceryl phosphate reductase 1; AltName: Full=Geranylgeranyl reductase 1; Short=GGR 1 [Methanothermobacter thermautotrophicus str. Delta H]AAB84783.1 bacteriochlorophyll synthase 43 kDa subunit [Methanothermobacter thermautotrophicus str. Delta H]
MIIMVTEVDVLVIGAGPAGSTAAKHAALGGADVLLIDKKSEIGAPKRCAEGVSIGGLESLGIEPNPRWITKKLDGVRMVSPNGTDVWLTSDKVELPEAGYILERKVFDKFMAMDAARAGSRIMVKTIATGMERTDDGYLVSAECMGEKFEIKARIVIAADGPESRVARWAGLNTATRPKDMESAAQFEMVGVEMEDNNCIEFYFGSVAPGGYALDIPEGDDIANVGLGVLSTETDKSAYEHLLEFVESCPATRNAQPVELNIGGDPVGGMPKKLVADSLMVVGDAAGQVNPLTGGGIISGMKGGMLAGQVAAAAVSEGDVTARRLGEYERLCREEIGDEISKYLKVKEYLLTLSDSELDSIAEAFQDVEFEKVSTTELVKKLIKVSPKALLKLGKLF